MLKQHLHHARVSIFRSFANGVVVTSMHIRAPPEKEPYDSSVTKL